jgi:hypothetical protein
VRPAGSQALWQCAIAEQMDAVIVGHDAPREYLDGALRSIPDKDFDSASAFIACTARQSARCYKVPL